MTTTRSRKVNKDLEQTVDLQAPSPFGSSPVEEIPYHLGLLLSSESLTSNVHRDDETRREEERSCLVQSALETLKHGMEVKEGFTDLHTRPQSGRPRSEARGRIEFHFGQLREVFWVCPAVVRPMSWVS